MRLTQILMMFLGIVLASQAGAATYVQPPLGRLVFNELLTTAIAAGDTRPIYLDKAGRYYGELIVETAEGTPTPAFATAPQTLSFEFEFWRRDKLQRSETVQVTLEPGERHKTLFWVDAPNQVPSRVQLRMTVRSAAAASLIEPGVDLRLQVTRKFEFSPIRPP